MTQVDEEMTVGQWDCIVGRRDVRDALCQSFRGLLSYFSNLVNEFPLTYHCKLIDDKSVSGGGQRDYDSLS